MRVPCATYRLQFNQNFGFISALRAARYLKDLGVDTIYASPVFEFLNSGYDITDPAKIDTRLGGYRGLEKLSAGLKKLGMLYLQDIVPNHMAYSGKNRLIEDIFKKGAKSPYYRYFDIDWNHHSKKLKGKVLAPFLGEAHSQAFGEDKIKLCLSPGGFELKYGNLSFPLKLESYPFIMGNYPPLVLSRCMQPQKIYRLHEKDSCLRSFINKRIDAVNSSRQLYFSMVGKQPFKLTYWKVANEQINYRRFFTINNLICVAAQKKEVFLHMHQGIKKMVDKGIVDGVRVDHIDGLLNPLQYIRELKKLLKTPFIIVEKILAYGEELPGHWPVWGTTGYDYLGYANGIFCKISNLDAFDRIYCSFTGRRHNLDQMAYQKKMLILEKHMQGDMDNLAHLIICCSERGRVEEIAPAVLKKAIICTLSSFPVYRTYTAKTISAQDRKYIEIALKEAKKREPGLEDEFKLLREALCGTGYRKFRMRFQQYSGPVAAKGFEDTLLYNYNRLLSLNEVGSNPAKFGVQLSEFYEFCRHRAQKWPRSLNATSTHDTKRGEDARARLNVLSEIPQLWEEKLFEWNKLNFPKKATPLCPDLNDEYFLYQAMLGCYTGPSPDFEERMIGYIIKAIREAKVHTAWIRPDTSYERGFTSFFKKLVDDRLFMGDFARFVDLISYWQSFTSLSQVLIKITSPGIPDFYQGTDLADFSLVDPDNRREVDYKKRSRLLSRIKRGGNDRKFLEKILQDTGSGMSKLFVTYKALKARRENMDNFIKGSFISLEVSGKHKTNIIAFARVYKNKWIATIAPRFFSQLVSRDNLPLGTAIFKDTKIHLPSQKAKDLIAERKTESFLAGDILSGFPVALLKGEEA